MNYLKSIWDKFLNLFRTKKVITKAKLGGGGGPDEPG